MARRRGFIKSKIPIAAHTQANLLVATADYHLSAVWLVLIDAYTKEPAAIQLYAHLRAFFWELYSLAELVLRQVQSVPAIGSEVTSLEWANW
jgi:hypothetical protein